MLTTAALGDRQRLHHRVKFVGSGGSELRRLNPVLVNARRWGDRRNDATLLAPGDACRRIAAEKASAGAVSTV